MAARFVGFADPGESGTNEQKMASYERSSNSLILRNCVQHGLRAPLEVCKRADDEKGVCEFIFGSESHAHFYLHKVYGADFNADIETCIDSVFGDQGEGVVTRVERGEPFRIVWMYPSYAGMVAICYESGRQTESEFREEEAAAKESTIAQQNEQVSVAPYTLQPTAALVNSIVEQNNFMQNIYDNQFFGQIQMMRLEPTKVVNGVPHYNSTASDAADAFRS